MARCGRKHGCAFCWVQIVHAKIINVATTCAARNKVQVLRIIGTEARYKCFGIWDCLKSSKLALILQY